jgi:hypothetical protein
LKKASAILFLTIYLFSTTEAHQLLKLPIIFQHFQEHQNESKNITFLQFLDMHYMHGSPKYADYERDMQLPFKTSGDCISSIVPAFVPVTVQLTVTRPIEILEKKIFNPRNQIFHSPYLSNIWQPPKFY